MYIYAISITTIFKYLYYADVRIKYASNISYPNHILHIYVKIYSCFSSIFTFHIKSIDTLMIIKIEQNSIQYIINYLKSYNIPCRKPKFDTLISKLCCNLSNYNVS
jgi:hypothetical protein